MECLHFDFFFTGFKNSSDLKGAIKYGSGILPCGISTRANLFFSHLVVSLTSYFYILIPDGYHDTLHHGSQTLDTRI